MRIITINLPEKYLVAIQILIDLKIYPNRSEAIRKALKEFLHAESIMSDELEFDAFKALMKPSCEGLEKSIPITKEPEPKVSAINSIKSPKSMKPMEKPKILYKLFHGELTFNYIVSYLKESKIPLNTYELADKLKINYSTVNNELNKLMKQAPKLIKPEKRRTKKGEGTLRWYYSLNESSFNQLLAGVCQD